MTTEQNDKLQTSLYYTLIKYSIVNIITLHTNCEQQILWRQDLVNV